MPSASKITLSDVAKAAGVSTGTVSRVLNQRAGPIQISPETTQHVLEVAARLGYRPNPFASALRTQKTGVLGVILRDIGDPFLSLLAQEIGSAARARGANLLFAHAEYDLDLAGRTLAFMHSHWFDGLLLVGDIPGDEALLAELDTTATPFLAVARGLQTSAPMVNVDEAAGIRLGLDHLLSLGHRQIAFIGNLEHGGVKERTALFEQTLVERGLPLAPGAVQVCANHRAAVLDCVRGLLARRPPPTAIFCATDLAALSALSAVQGAGLRVPQDVSILGFDDIPGAAEAYPALTTLRQPVAEMARQAVALLLAAISGVPWPEPPRLILPPELIIRESCSHPPPPDGGPHAFPRPA